MGTRTRFKGLAEIAVQLDVDALQERLQELGVRVIGIDGPGGSGKSTLARMLTAGWPGAITVGMDDFYRPSAERQGGLSTGGASYDRERLIAEVLAPLRAGATAGYRRLDWEADRLVQGQIISAGSVLVLEGVYSISAPLREYLDYTIWITCPDELRLRRGIERDGERMRTRWVDEWMPAEERYLREEQPDQGVHLQLDGSPLDGAQPSYQVLAYRSK